MIRIVLEGSYSKFEFYQKWDTAMCGKVSPTYANILKVFSPIDA